MFGIKSNRTTFFYLGATASILASSGLVYWYSSKWLTKTFSSLLTGLNNGNNNDEDKDKELTDDEIYINKYYDKFNSLMSDDIEEDRVKELKKSVLYEDTPRGRVILYYDFEKESFVYYCDTKDIPYSFLESVARKYVTINKCKKIMVDMKEELKLAKDKIAQEKIVNVRAPRQVNVESNKGTKDMFASFKSYNRKGSGGSNSNTLDKKFILCGNANRYSYLGKISDYSFLDKTGHQPLRKIEEAMNYASFKKMSGK
jgi:hypothetical protein